MKTILFVCIENSNRSQMAQAFAKIYGQEKIQAYSAGSNPSGKINLKAIAAMREIGYDLSVHTSKSLEEIPQITYDFLVGMGCGDKCPFVPAKTRLEWDIPDPKNMPEEDFRKVRNTIAKKVRELIENM